MARSDARAQIDDPFLGEYSRPMPKLRRHCDSRGDRPCVPTQEQPRLRRPPPAGRSRFLLCRLTGRSDHAIVRPFAARFIDLDDVVCQNLVDLERQQPPGYDVLTALTCDVIIAPPNNVSECPLFRMMIKLSILIITKEEKKTISCVLNSIKIAFHKVQTKEGDCTVAQNQIRTPWSLRCRRHTCDGIYERSP